MAEGRPWCGIEPTRPVKVLLFDEEQDENTAARLLLRLGQPSENLLVAVGQGLRMDTAEGIARIEAEINEHRPDLVIGDSVQQLFGAADENSATAIGGVYRELFRLRDTYKLAFLLLHHKRKESQYFRTEALEMVRGSTAHGTQSSTVWVAHSPGGNRLNIVQPKRRGAPKLSLVILYEESEENGSISLIGGGTVEAAETAKDAALEWIVAYLAGQGAACRRQAILEAAMTEGHAKPTIERALKFLTENLRTVQKIGRGWYQFVSG